MSDAETLLAILAALVVALAMMSLAALKGWDGWLQLRRLELSQRRDGVRPAPSTAAGARIELADLRERVKRLEAIANGDEAGPRV